MARHFEAQALQGEALERRLLRAAPGRSVVQALKVAPPPPFLRT